MADHVVYTGFDPEFGDRLNRLLALAKGEGYTPNLISGTRAAYAWPGMKGQSQAELYAQVGKPGGPRRAAPPGYSPHQYGVAGDVTGIPQSELERLAPEVGLRAIHDDPNHIELANWQREAALQPAATPWKDVPNVPSSYAMNVGDTSAPAGNGQFTPPGMNLNSNPFVNSLIQIESGNKNIFSGVDKDYPGQPGSRSQGYVQADVPTWQQFAPKAGIDVGQYPTPMNAPRDVQAQGIAEIPLSRFGSQTRNRLAQQYGQLDTSKTIGQLAAQFGGAGGPGPGNVGPVTGFLPGQSTGQGGIGSDTVASRGAATPTAPSIASQIAGPLQSLTKSLDDSGQQQQGNQGGQQAQQQLQAEQAAAAYGQQRQQALASHAQQLMAQVLAQGRKPLSWGSAPPGAMMGAGAGQLPPPPQTPAPQMGADQSITADEMLAQLMQQGGALGISLNSIGDYNG